MNRARQGRAWRVALSLVMPLTAALFLQPAFADDKPDEDNGRGDGYAYHIVYPSLQREWQALNGALHEYAAAQKKEFLAAQEPAKPEAHAHQLDLKFNVARRTDDFISVLADGSSDTGGAHPQPLVTSFVLHTADNKLVAIGDLFTDTNAALKVLSDESRNQLEGRLEAQLRDQLGDVPSLATTLKTMKDTVEHGTEPDAKNFASFLVDGIDSKAIGLTLVFPPYQVASYADGTQQVEVPAKLFHALLKPEFVTAFHWDTEAEKNASR